LTITGKASDMLPNQLMIIDQHDEVVPTVNYKLDIVEIFREAICYTIHLLLQILLNLAD
jgi:hypothetical protein